MWIFGRHRHLDLRVLSEYLDGLLSTGERAGVSRRLASCASCQAELEGLRATVALLQGLEDLPIPRSFTLTGPPPEPVAVRNQPLPFRAPNWAYAGAASLAGLALAFMVSADATGQLTTSPLSMEQDRVTIATVPQTAEDSAMAASSADASPTAEPEVAAAPQAESMQAFEAAEAQDSSDGREQAQSAPPEETEQAPMPAQGLSAVKATSVPVPTPAPQPGSASPQGPPGPAGPAGATGTDAAGRSSAGQAVPEDDAQETTTMTMMAENQQESATNEIVPTSGPSPASDLTVVQETGTPLFWRVLEGVAAGIAAVLLAVLLLKWRRSRRTTQ